MYGVTPPHRTVDAYVASDATPTINVATTYAPTPFFPSNSPFTRSIGWMLWFMPDPRLHV
jgi:hypothetical protein